MKTIYDLSRLEWTFSGCIPYVWKLEKTCDMGNGSAKTIEVYPFPARVPGTVQMSLLDAGLIENWNIGDNSKNANGSKTVIGFTEPRCPMIGSKEIRSILWNVWGLTTRDGFT